MAFALLKKAHDRPSHLEKAIYARLGKILNNNSTEPTIVLVEVLMCPSFSSYYCDESRTLNLLRPYFESLRKGIKHYYSPLIPP